MVLARALPVILTAVVRDETLIVLIAEPTVTGELLELVTVKVDEVEVLVDVPPSLVDVVPLILSLVPLASLRVIEPLPTLMMTSLPLF